MGKVETVQVSEFYEHIDEAERAIGDTDPDDVLYLACALGRDAAIWSDDSDFEVQNLVPVYTTGEVIESFDTDYSCSGRVEVTDPISTLATWLTPID